MLFLFLLLCTAMFQGALAAKRVSKQLPRSSSARKTAAKGQSEAAAAEVDGPETLAGSTPAPGGGAVLLQFYDRCGSNYIKRVSSTEILDPILEEIRTQKGDETLCFLYEGEQVHGHQSPVDLAGESLPISLLNSVESGLDRVRDRFVEHCATYAENLPAGLYSKLLEYTSENRCVDKLCREKWRLDAFLALVLLTQELWVDIFGDKEVASEN